MKHSHFHLYFHSSRSVFTMPYWAEALSNGLNGFLGYQGFLLKSIFPNCSWDVLAKESYDEMTLLFCYTPTHYLFNLFPTKLFNLVSSHFLSTLDPSVKLLLHLLSLLFPPLLSLFFISPELLLGKSFHLLQFAMSFFVFQVFKNKPLGWAFWRLCLHSFSSSQLP